MLSSGERHLLLLFCNTLIALDRQSIFIIDEPEISLNIKWQRKLLDSLLECAGENPVQYIFATHSFELLAQHKDNTIKLTEALEDSNGSKANT
jgi:predicted ATP-dependent endonuclease of OLD family